MDDIKVVRCCFCHELVLWRKSHNPYPASDKLDARCCEDCNLEVVIPARLSNYFPKNG